MTDPTSPVDRAGGAITDRLLTELRAIVGERHVLTDADARAGYETDWSGRWHGAARAVVRAADADQVADVLRACGASGTAVVTQGGNTGLVGGATPTPAGDQIVLSTARLDGLDAVDPATRQVTCGAAVTLARLQRVAAEAGLAAGLDLGARDSATVGGLAACDAGGLQAIRYGTARRRIAGLEAVLANGTVVRERLSGLIKDNAGYDLGALLIGSEGTLGVITRVRWSLVPRLAARATALVALDGIPAAVEAARGLLAALPSLELLELVDAAGAELALRHLAIDEPPLPVSPAWLFVECAAATDPEDELAEALARLGLDDAAVLAVDAAGRERLLAIRESQADAIARVGIPHKLDVGVPLDRLQAFLTQLPQVLHEVAPAARPVVFGHLGDGNLHVNLLGLGPDDEAVDLAVLTLVAHCGGTITAEHGVGRHKPRYLSLVRSAAELDAMCALKRALDPDGILNPGVGLDCPAV